MVRWVKSLPEKVADSIVVPALAVVIIAVASLALGLLDDKVPVWAALVILLVLAGGAFALGRGARTDVEELEEFVELLQLQVDLHQYYADHLYDVLETLQKVITGQIPEVTFADLVERGMLQPAREYLQVSGEDVRLSVQVPDDEHQNFIMEFSAGHSLGGSRDFRLPIAGSFGGHAYASGEVQWTGDVSEDSRWSKHPKASQERVARVSSDQRARPGNRRAQRDLHLQAGILAGRPNVHRATRIDPQRRVEPCRRGGAR